MQNKHGILFLLNKRKVLLNICLFRQNGFTLLELLISLVISSILAIGVGSVYYGIRSTQNSQNSVSEIRDSVFIALDRIESSIKHASFIEYGDQRFNPNESYMAISLPITPSIGLENTTLNTTTSNGSDTFTVEVSSADIANDMIDCTGASMPVNSGTLKKSVYQKFTAANDSLTCSTNIKTKDMSLGTESYSGFLTPVKVASGVKNMQIFYAVKNSTNGCGVDSIGSSNSWKTASEITDWSKICAVNISLLVSSQTGQSVNVAQETTTTQHFNLAPNNSVNDNIAKDVTVSVSSSLLKNTRIIKKTVFLRNNDKY